MTEQKDNNNLDPDRKYEIPHPATIIATLERLLIQTALVWRENPTAESVRLYHEIYDQLIELGWNGAIDIDAELPDDLMPTHYREQIGKLKRS
jgi:hypothetical protein